jgi:hypothetical protein
VELHNLPELACVGGVIIATALVKFGIWLESKLHSAEARECRRIWFEEITPNISWPERDWPPTGQAYEYFFDTAAVRYDSAADAAGHIARMEADVREFLDKMIRS